MATVFRKTYTKPLPNKADIFTRKGERFARWKDSKGKTRTALLTTGRNGSDRIIVTAGTYTAKYRDGSGIVREVATGCRDEMAARSILSDLERRAELVKANVMTAAGDAIADHQSDPLVTHITAYIDFQKANGLNAVRIANTHSRLKRIAEDCRFLWLSDLNGESLGRWLAARKGEEMGAGTRNGYREACVAFGSWCVRSKRLLSNPFADVPKADAKADCPRKRRSLTEEELTRFLEAARRRPLLDAMMIRRGPNKGKAIAKVSTERRLELETLGRERMLIYKTYLLTGLRKSEFASLTVGQVFLDEPMPFLDLAAANEKNREGSQIPLRSDLAAELDQWIVEKKERLTNAATIAIDCQQSVELPAETPLFNIPSGLLRILNRDLKFAGIPKVDERGRTVDIHALRHTFGTHLSKAGIAPRTAQAAMRHSSIDLTMNVYTDPKLLDVHGALDALPAMSLEEKPDQQTNILSATGTDNRPDSSLAPNLAPTWCKLSHSGSNVGKVADNDVEHKSNTANVVSPVMVKRKEPLSIADNGFHKSGRQDLNLRPLRPEGSCLVIKDVKTRFSGCLLTLLDN